MNAASFRNDTNELCEKRDFLLAHRSHTWLWMGDCNPTWNNFK